MIFHRNVVRLNDSHFKAIMATVHQFMEHFFLHVMNRQKKLVSSYLLLIKCGYQNRGWESRDVSVDVSEFYENAQKNANDGNS